MGDIPDQGELHQTAAEQRKDLRSPKRDEFLLPVCVDHIAIVLHFSLPAILELPRGERHKGEDNVLFDQLGGLFDKDLDVFTVFFIVNINDFASLTGCQSFCHARRV